MAALTDNLQTDRQEGDLTAFEMGVDIAYRGSLVNTNTSGYLVAGQDVSGYRFQGVAYEKKDNSGGSAGDVSCRVHRRGIFKFAGSGFAITDVGKKVFISDDQTVTLTPGYVYCGNIAKFVSSTEVWVDIEPAVQAVNGDIITVTANVHTIVGTVYGLAFTCPAGRQATVLSGKVTAMVKPVYATDEILSCYKYDLDGTSAEAVLESNSYDLDGLTALQSADLTLQSTTPANLDLEAGDTLYIGVVCTGAETTPGDVAVTFEIALS